MIARLRGKGQITIPARVRAALGLAENDVVSIVKVGEAILLAPQPSTFESTAKKFSAKAKRESITLEILLKDLRQVRHPER